MDNITDKSEPVNTQGAKTAQRVPSAVEPILSSNKARVVVAQLKGCKKVDQATLNRLVKREGLPKHDNPFGDGTWCFRESEIRAWFEAKMAAGQPLPGPGRPRRKVA